MNNKYKTIVEGRTRQKFNQKIGFFSLSFIFSPAKNIRIANRNFLMDLAALSRLDSVSHDLLSRRARHLPPNSHHFLDSLTPPSDFPEHYEDLFACLSRNFGKGFMLGVGAKAAQSAFQVRKPNKQHIRISN